MSIWGNKYTSKFNGMTEEDEQEKEKLDAEVGQPVKIQKTTGDITGFESFKDLMCKSMEKVDISIWEMIYIAGYDTDVADKDADFDDLLNDIQEIEDELESSGEVDLDDYPEVQRILLLCGVTNVRLDSKNGLLCSTVDSDTAIESLFGEDEDDEDFSLSNPEKTVVLRALYANKIGVNNDRVVNSIFEMKCNDAESQYSAKVYKGIAEMFGLKFENFHIMVK